MADDNSLQTWINKQVEEEEESINLRKIFFKMLSNWPFFAGALLVTLACAYCYNKFTTPIYNVSTTMLIEENKNTTTMNTNTMMKIGIGIRQDMQNIDNQMLKLSSYTIVGRALDELPFNIDYFSDGHSLYPDQPIRVIPVDSAVVPYGIKFTLTCLKGNEFSLDAEPDTLTYPRKASFGETITTSAGMFRVERVRKNWPAEKSENTIDFRFINHSKLTESYSNRLKTETASKNGTIIRISLLGSNIKKEVDFLNKLTEVFLNSTLEKKNKEAIRTIQFIDEQLVDISDSLIITENRLQQFRSKNMVMDLSAQGKVIIDQAMKLENDKALLMLKANYYKYLSDYLKKENTDEGIIAPSTQGITDPGLTRLVSELADLQNKYYSMGLGDKNPMKGQLLQNIRNTRDALVLTLNGLRNANDMAIKDNVEQIRNTNAQAASLPMKEQQLLGIERKYKVNDVLYTFLLQKRAEAQITKASNIPDNEIVDPARANNNPVSPKRTMSYLIALVLGLGIPFVWIWAADAFNIRIADEDDIKKITDVPIVGHIPHSILLTQNVVFDDQNSHVTEAFRTLRTKMQYFTKDTKSPVILITSSMPGEGKTFTAINLASVYSLMGKKTVLVGFDLRRPKIFTEFGLTNDIGISTWLIGRDSLDDIINKTAYPNLDVILAGEIPPNPAELIASEKTTELFAQLKTKYDYIIVDTAPLGAVSDAYTLMPFADATLLIVRDNNTFKHALEKTITETDIHAVKNISILENDIHQAKLVYQYGYRYGYRYGYAYNAKPEKKGFLHFFKWLKA